MRRAEFGEREQERKREEEKEKEKEKERESESARDLPRGEVRHLLLAVPTSRAA